MRTTDGDVNVNVKLNAWANSKIDFVPRSPVDGQDNHKTTFIVFPNGSARPVVRLLADGARQREGIIIQHYLRFFAKYVENAEIGVDFVGRDEPWDATIQINKRQQFNLEITALAEDANSYAVNAKDQEYKGLAKKDVVSSAELKKVEKWFGKEAAPDKTEVTSAFGNPLTPTEERIVISVARPPIETWSDIIINLITKKSQKSHPRKESTAIIIDNQAILLTKAELLELREEITTRLQDQVFPEIFFYTGFFGDLDGTNASFSIIPLKISGPMRERLIRSRLLTGDLGSPYGEYLIDDGSV